MAHETNKVNLMGNWKKVLAHETNEVGVKNLLKRFLRFHKTDKGDGP